MFDEEGGGLFDARSASLGHTLQGGVPSPMDRVHAVRLSIKCMQFLEQHHREAVAHGHKRNTSDNDTAAVITIQSSSLKWVPVREVHRHADMQNRRGKNTWWAGIKTLTENLGAKSQFLGLHPFGSESPRPSDLIL
jgi:6-phosphofructokinase 1